MFSSIRSKHCLAGPRPGAEFTPLCRVARVSCRCMNELRVPDDDKAAAGRCRTRGEHASRDLPRVRYDRTFLEGQVAIPAFEGHRTFTWFTPQRRRATEYELYTVGQQSSPQQWLNVDWPIRFDDGREPYTASSTVIRCGNWHDYRDPAALWQRPYIAAANHEEQALGRLIPGELSAGLAAGMDEAWLDPMLSRYYGAWPFVEYGLFSRSAMRYGRRWGTRSRSPSRSRPVTACGTCRTSCI
jgi:hypothetical protein